MGTNSNNINNNNNSQGYLSNDGQMASEASSYSHSFVSASEGCHQFFVDNMTVTQDTVDHQSNQQHILPPMSSFGQSLGPLVDDTSSAVYSAEPLTFYSFNNNNPSPQLDVPLFLTNSHDMTANYSAQNFPESTPSQEYSSGFNDFSNYTVSSNHVQSQCFSTKQDYLQDSSCFSNNNNHGFTQGNWAVDSSSSVHQLTDSMFNSYNVSDNSHNHCFERSQLHSNSQYNPASNSTQDPLVSQTGFDALHSSSHVNHRVPSSLSQSNLSSLQPTSMETTNESSHEYVGQEIGQEIYSSLNINDSTCADPESLFQMDSSDLIPTQTQSSSSVSGLNPLVSQIHSSSSVHDSQVDAEGNSSQSLSSGALPVLPVVVKTSQKSKKPLKLSNFEKMECFRCKVCNFLCLEESQAKKHEKEKHEKPKKKEKKDKKKASPKLSPASKLESNVPLTTQVTLPDVPEVTVTQTVPSVVTTTTTTPVIIIPPPPPPPVSVSAPKTTGPTSYVCYQCKQSFGSLDDCKVHMASEHNITQVILRPPSITLSIPDDRNGLKLALPKLSALSQQQQQQQQPEPTVPKSVSKDNPKPDLTLDSSEATPLLKKKKKSETKKRAWKVKMKKEQSYYSCQKPKCTCRFSNLENLEEHTRCHSDSGHGFACSHCDSFKNESWNSMAGHLWRSHAIDLDLFKCEHCDYRSYSYSILENIHKKIHSTEKNYVCPICNKGFKNAKQLINHKARHDKKASLDKTESGDRVASKELLHVCDLCAKMFPDARPLRIHMDIVHKKKKLHTCLTCGHSAATKGALRVHIRSHTGEKPFKCEQCDYSTSDHNSLRRHKMRHSGERPYKCPFCDYACIQVRI